MASQGQVVSTDDWFTVVELEVKGQEVSLMNSNHSSCSSCKAAKESWGSTGMLVAEKQSLSHFHQRLLPVVRFRMYLPCAGCSAFRVFPPPRESYFAVMLSYLGPDKLRQTPTLSKITIWQIYKLRDSRVFFQINYSIQSKKYLARYQAGCLVNKISIVSKILWPEIMLKK